MCLTTPGKIVRIDTPTTEVRFAEVDFGVATRRVNLLFTPEVTVGDFVIAHAGYATRQVPEAEAREALGYLRELGETTETGRRSAHAEGRA